MPKVKDGRTVEKVRFIISLLDIAFEYRCHKTGGYEFIANGISIKLSRAFLWMNTSVECAKHIKELYIKEVFNVNNPIDQDLGARYIIEHQQRNIRYIEYLEGLVGTG